MKRVKLFPMLLTLPMLALALLPAGAAAGKQEAAGERPLTLEELEQMALQHNPSFAQASALVRAARGRQRQAGLYPNPSVGYMGDEISTGPVIRGGEHGFFVQQEFVTGGKLGLSRNVAAQEELLTEAEAETQKYRVLNSVRTLYYQALAAQQLVELQGRLADISREAVDISEQLYNVGQADRPDVLEAEVEAQRVELALLVAHNEHQRVWRQLAAAVGVPSLPPAPLAGTLEDSLPELEFDALLETLLRESPEVRTAQAGVGRAEQGLKRARAEWIPNLIVRGGLRNNRELLETGGRPVGLEGFLEAGVQIPIFNRNQGNVQAAEADLERARLEVERVKLSLRARLAAAYRNYKDSRALVQKYREEVLPRAQEAYELYLNSFKQMAAAYPQVLIAQRTHFQLQVDYVAALGQLWRTSVEIRGLLVRPEPEDHALGDSAGTLRGER